MKCNEFEKLVSEYIDGMLSERKKNAFKKHMETCAKCKKIYNDMKLTVDMLGDVQQVDLPPTFHKNLKQSLSNLNKKDEANQESNVIDYNKDKRDKKRRRIKIMKVATTLAACVVIVLGIIAGGNYLVDNFSNKTQEMQPEENTGTEYSLKSNEVEDSVDKKTFDEKSKKSDDGTIRQEETLAAKTAQEAPQEAYVQNCYKINVITQDVQKTVEMIKNLMKDLNSKYDENSFEIKGDTGHISFSIPNIYYSKLIEEIWNLKNEKSIQGFIENKVSAIDYEYEMEQINDKIEQINAELKELSKNKKLISEKENELVKLNTRLKEINDLVQYSNVTIEIT